MTQLHLHLFNLQQHMSCLQIILCVFTCVCCRSILVINKNHIFICPIPLECQLLSRADATGSRIQQLVWQRLARSSSILGILPVFKLTISKRQQIAHGGLFSICPGPDNCPLADAQQPMPTVLVSRVQMQRTLGVASQPQSSSLLQGQEVTLTLPPSSLKILSDY